MFDFLKNLFNRPQPVGRQDANGNTLPPPPGPTTAPVAVVDRRPEAHELAWVYPKNWKYVVDPDGGKRPLKSGKPVGIVIHHTATYDLNTTVDFFTKNEVDVHFVMGKDGSVIQMVPCNMEAAHAGESAWGNYAFLNCYFLGIEVVNIGQLHRIGDKFYDAYNREYKGEVRVRKVFGEQYWQPFTEQQETALFELCSWLVKEYDIPTENVITHYEASPGRKTDPAGGMKDFPMSKFRDLLKG